MLHPSLARALANAHIEDQLRAAARWRTVRLARRARTTRGGVRQSPFSDPPRLDYVDGARPGPRHDTSGVPQTAQWPRKSAGAGCAGSVRYPKVNT